MDIQLLMWVLFWFVVTVSLFIDLAILNKRKWEMKIKESVAMVCIWVCLALCFGLTIYFTLGHAKALEYFTGYIVEYSLSIDNMFVFLMIFSYFLLPKANQSKVLIYGIVGAIALRLLFVLIGIKLINSFHWIIYIFGALLIFTAIKMLYKKGRRIRPDKNIAYKILKKLIPFKPDITTNKFYIKGKKVLYATPMVASLIVIEMSDLIFAIDSIPAVLSISKDAFIVYSSNIFAIIGLRSLYFLISNLAAKFKFLQFGTAIILIFVGIKMLLSDYIGIPTLVSLAIIISIISISIIISNFKQSH